MAKRTTAEKTITAPVPAEPALPAVYGDDVKTVTELGGEIGKWARGALAFFTQAAALEAEADAVLAEAKALTPPTDKASDETVQRLAIRAKDPRASIVEHWKTKGIFHKLHKCFVSHESRALGKIDEGVGIANRLHNAWSEQERQRVAKEQREAQDREDQRARDDRAREVKRLEDQALANEAASAGLSEREHSFVEQFVIWSARGDQCPETNAARIAGYADPVKQGARLITTQKILVAIEGERAAVALRKQAEGLRQQPIETKAAEPVEAQIGSFAGSRTTRSAEVYDEAAFLAAVFDGTAGIPRDVLCIDTAKLNGYARQLDTLINAWPGVRLKKDRKIA